MTTWTTFETIDEMAKIRENSDSEYERNIDNTFWVDVLGNVQRYEHQIRQTRFEVARVMKTDGNIVWSVIDWQSEDDQGSFTTGTMHEIVRFVAGRVLYGA